MNKNIVLEALRPQLGDWFPKKLLEVITRIYGDLKSDVNITNQAIAKNYGKEIHDLIEKRFGLNVSLDPLLWAGSPMGIFCFSTLKLGADKIGLPDSASSNMSAGNEIDEEFIHEYLDALDNFSKDKKEESMKYDGEKGTVDFENLHVSGYMSKVTNLLTIDFLTLYSKIGITEEEMVAMILHEIGHPFTTFAYEADLVGTNRVIEQCSKEIEKGNLDKAVYIYRSRFGEDDLKKAMTSRTLTKEVFYSKLLARHTNVYQSHYGSAAVDGTQSEVLADTFATAFGYAGFLASGLKKFSDTADGPDYGIGFPLFRFALASTAAIVALTFMPIIALSTIPSILITGVGLGFSTYNASEGFINDPYDNDKVRFTKMRQQTIALLKSPNVPKEQVKGILETIDLLAKLSKEASVPGSTAASLRSLFSTSYRRKLKQRERQEKIESLLNNDLFALNQKLLSI